MRDLFGEIPVTLHELLLWMLAVPGIPPDSPRFVNYLRGYDVIGKIRQAKAQGTLQAILEDDQRPAPARIAAALSAANSRPAGRAPGRSPHPR